jgi:hypothetical protein
MQQDDQALPQAIFGVFEYVPLQALCVLADPTFVRSVIVKIVRMRTAAGLVRCAKKLGVESHFGGLRRWLPKNPPSRLAGNS